MQGGMGWTKSWVMRGSPFGTAAKWFPTCKKYVSICICVFVYFLYLYLFIFIFICVFARLLIWQSSQIIPNTNVANFKTLSFKKRRNLPLAQLSWENCPGMAREGNSVPKNSKKLQFFFHISTDTSSSSFVFVYLYLCSCICVFVFVFVYLCICVLFNFNSSLTFQLIPLLPQGAFRCQYFHPFPEMQKV